MTSPLRVPTLLLAPLALLALEACDTSGYASLGEPLDTVVPCGPDSTTWVRSSFDEEGAPITEFVLIGTDDFSGAASHEGCFNFGRLWVDTSTELHLGKFHSSGTTLTATEGELYTFPVQPELNILQRTGARRTLVDPVIPVDLDFASDGATLTLTDAKGVSKRYRNIVDLVASLDLSTEAGQYGMARIYNLPLWTSLVRVLGYGSGGMTQYMGSTSEFAAMATGRFTIGVEGLLMPKTTIAYYEFVEWAGLMHDGVYDTVTDTKGDGESHGYLDFAFRDDLDDPTSVVTGTMEFTAPLVMNGFGDGGYYTMVVDGVGYVIPSAIYNSIDLTDVLPPE